MQAMALFEQTTGAKLKDCIQAGDALLFVVEPQEMGRALGKNAQKLHQLRSLFKRKIKILEFDPDVAQFVRNLLYPLRPREVAIHEDVVVIDGGDPETRGRIIGTGHRNLREQEEIVQRHFPVRLKVV